MITPAAEKKTVVDIEDAAKRSEPAEEKLDKLTGFHKYERSGAQYRKVEERLSDWGEIFNHREVKKVIQFDVACLCEVT